MPVKRSALIATLAVALALPAAAAAVPTAVHLRVEGATQTIFDGPVTTDGKTVNPATGGARRCDGTNGGANPSSGPTPTTALDDVAKTGAFTWAGTWWDSMSDYTVDRIGPDSADFVDFRFWGLFINEEYAEVGGCQFRIKPGDEVLWAYDAYALQAGVLSLSGPSGANPGAPARVRVVKARAGTPIAGATVGGATTDASGFATLTFDRPGIQRVRAEHPLYVRSRVLTVCVDPPGAEECTYGDTTAPTVRLDAPVLASDLARRASRIPLSWQGDDGTGSGVKRYRVEIRRAGKPDSAWRLLRTETASTAGRLNGSEGVAYELRVRAFDRAANASAPASATTIVPVDNLSNGVRFSKRGWKLLRRHGAWEQSTSRATRRGASAALTFSGTQATLVTRPLPNGGRVRISVDGKSKVVSLKGRGRFRTKLVSTPRVAAGRHTVRIVSLGRAPVEVDAIAVRP